MGAGRQNSGCFALHWGCEPSTARRRDRPPGDPLQSSISASRSREHVPLTVWDGKVRMSVAGRRKTKLLVYLDRPMRTAVGSSLVDGPRLASTHSQARHHQPADAAPGGQRTLLHVVGAARGLPAAEVGLLRTPRPVLVVRRFDREAQRNRRRVAELSVGTSLTPVGLRPLPVAHKYERNLGSAGGAPHLRRCEL